MIPTVPGRSATGRVAAALLMSSPQTSPAPRATSNWSGTSAGIRVFRFRIKEEFKAGETHSSVFFFFSQTRVVR